MSPKDIYISQTEIREVYDQLFRYHRENSQTALTTEEKDTIWLQAVEIAQAKAQNQTKAIS